MNLQFELTKKIARILATQFFNGSQQEMKLSREKYLSLSMQNWMDAARGIITLVKHPEKFIQEESHFDVECDFYNQDDTLQMFADLRNSNRVVTIGDKQFRELINVLYQLPYNELTIEQNVPEPHEEDRKEREYLLIRSEDCIRLLKDCEHSRQAIYTNLYPNNMAKCIVSAHFFVRDGKVYLNMYIRSQEATKNFNYDHQTACLLMKKVAEALDLEKGQILIFAANLHYTMEESKNV